MRAGWGEWGRTDATASAKAVTVEVLVTRSRSAAVREALSPVDAHVGRDTTHLTSSMHIVLPSQQVLCCPTSEP